MPFALIALAIGAFCIGTTEFVTAGILPNIATFEIGGKNKTARQIQEVEKSFLAKDDILSSRQREIPLMLFVLMYPDTIGTLYR